MAKDGVDNYTHKANIMMTIIGKMQIYQLGSLDGEGDRDVPTYGIEAIEVYPQTLSAVEYNYGSSNQIVKINVGFAYKQWYNLTTDHIAGMTLAIVNKLYMMSKVQIEDYSVDYLSNYKEQEEKYLILLNDRFQ